MLTHAFKVKTRQSYGVRTHKHTWAGQHQAWALFRGAVEGRLMEAGRQAFREESVCSTAWQSQPPSISITHIHMPLGRGQLLREWPEWREAGGWEVEWDGCREGGGGACQTPVMLLFPASAPPQRIHVTLVWTPDRATGASSGRTWSEFILRGRLYPPSPLYILYLLFIGF